MKPHHQSPFGISMPDGQRRRYDRHVRHSRCPSSEEDIPHRNHRRRRTAPRDRSSPARRTPSDDHGRVSVPTRRSSPQRMPAHRRSAADVPPPYQTYAPNETLPAPHRVYEDHGDLWTDQYHGHRRPRDGQGPRPQPRVPYHLRADPRLPLPGSKESTLPITLKDRDGYEAYSLLLLSPPSRTLTALVATASTKFRAHRPRIHAEDLIETALGNGILSHVSDGPRGGIWVVEKEREDIVGALMNLVDSRWKMLGRGCGGSEGRLFMVHSCGRGGPDIVEDEVVMKGKDKAKVMATGLVKDEGQVVTMGKDKGTGKGTGGMRGLMGRIMDGIM